MRIYYLSLDLAQPVGGISKIYRHVDILNNNGFSAFVLHGTPGFRCTWFRSETKVAYWLNNDWKQSSWQKVWRKVEGWVRKKEFPASKKIYFTDGQPPRIFAPDDWVVIPEVLGPGIAHIAPGVKKVIFNQNAYFTFKEYSFNKNDLMSPYTDTSGEVVGVMVISDDNEDYLRYVFPKGTYFRISHYSRCLDLFSYEDNKKRQICFMTRKHREDARQVINILKFRGVLTDFEIVIIEDRSLEETVKIMKESLIFLSFGYPEGSSLPPSEALACGCIVIGYHGGGGKEYFKSEFSYPIEAGDIIGFAKTVERVIKEWRTDPLLFKEKAKAAADFIKEHYSPEKEEKELVLLWNKIIQQEQRVC